MLRSIRPKRATTSLDASVDPTEACKAKSYRRGGCARALTKYGILATGDLSWRGGSTALGPATQRPGVGRSRSTTRPACAECGGLIGSRRLRSLPRRRARPRPAPPAPIPATEATATLGPDGPGPRRGRPARRSGTEGSQQRARRPRSRTSPTSRTRSGCGGSTNCALIAWCSRGVTEPCPQPVG
jgi:hypothetical protein